jgi:hypothetical protein
VDSGSSGPCLPGANFQEPWELLQSWENKACGQWESWDLLGGMGYEETQQLLQAWGNQAFRQREFWGLLVWHGLQKGSTVAHQAWGNKAFVKWEPWDLLAKCQHQAMRVYSSCCKHGGSKLVGSGSPGTSLPAQVSSSMVQQLLPTWGTKPAGLCLLLPWSSGSPVSCLYKGAGFPNISG